MSQSQSNKKKFDWSIVVEILIQILTLGLGHVKKHKSGNESAE